MIERSPSLRAAEFRLGVILEQGGGYSSMRNAGQEGRLRYYLRRYAEFFDEVVFFSYERERIDAKDIHPAVRIVPRRFPVGGTMYSVAMPFVARREMSRCDILRVLQMSAAVPAALAKSLYGLPYVVTFGYDLPTLARQRGWIHGKWAELNIRAASRSAEAIVFGTKFLGEQVQAYGPRGALVQLPNGVDLNLFKPRRARKVSTGAWQIMSVGRLSPEKNYAALIESLRDLPGVELHLVGSGPEQATLQHIAERAAVRLVLHGTVPQTSLPRLLSNSDLFVLPSRTEGHPKALLEAMACALPCIGAREAPGIRSVLEHEVNGILTEGSPSGLRSGIEKLLADRDLAAGLASAARKKVETDFNLETIVDSELQMLRDVAERFRRTHDE